MQAGTASGRVEPVAAKAAGHVTLDAENDPPDAAVPPWWCGRCDQTKCLQCQINRIALQRVKAGVQDDDREDEEPDEWT